MVLCLQTDRLTLPQTGTASSTGDSYPSGSIENVPPNWTKAYETEKSKASDFRGSGIQGLRIPKSDFCFLVYSTGQLYPPDKNL